MKITNRRPDSIKPYPGNPRINDKAVDAVAASIRQFGFRQSIVVDGDDVIIVGHTRWKAAIKLGLKKVPVHVATGLTADQCRAYRIADNQTGDLAGWDFEKLTKELDELEGAEFDLAGLGFPAGQLAALMDPELRDGLTDPDAVPDAPDKATTRKGDLWILGEHRLLCGDSSRTADVDRLMGGQPGHLVNTDPPYNVNVEPRSNNAIAAGISSFSKTHHQSFDVHRHPGKAKATHRKMRPKDRPLENDFLSDADFEHLLQAWFGQMARVLEPGRGFYIWGGYANVANYPGALEGAGLYFSQAIIWVKQHPVLTRKDFMGNHEWCFYGWKKGAAHRFAFGQDNVPDVWEISTVAAGKSKTVTLEGNDGLVVEGPGGQLYLVAGAPDGRHLTAKLTKAGTIRVVTGVPSDVWQIKKISPQAMVHLTEKPVELATKAILLSTVAGENVVDFFGGSGSTLIGAERASRHAFLMELDQLYCDVIVKRWEDFTGRKATRQAATRETRAKKTTRKGKAKK